MFMEAEVEAGIAYLNENCPGWEDRINWEELRMGNHLKCIGGQLGGNYFQWRNEQGITTEERAIDLGFNVRPEEYRFPEHPEMWLIRNIALYEDLADTWRAKAGKECVPA
jgi:hypothetical protein